jgi:hypothetical protein
MRKKWHVLLATILTFALTTGFTSCSSDDDNDGEKGIIGTWVIKEEVKGIVTTNSTENDGKIALDIADEYDYFNQTTFTFKADGKVIVTERNDTGEYPYTYTNNILKITFHPESPEDPDIETYNVVVDGNTLTFSFDCLEEYEDMELDYIINLGIKDPFSFTISKAIATAVYSRK